MAGKNIVTRSGLNKMEKELHDLKLYLSNEMPKKIKEASDQGDLSENAEYDAAKNEQGDVQTRIKQLEEILRNIEEVVDENEVNLDVVNIGSRVRVFDVEFDEEIEFCIVGPLEASSLSGKISYESPVGKALLGAKVGDLVTVESQAGESQYKVISISRV